MQINQYPNTATSLADDDLLDIDKALTPTGWQSQKIAWSDVLGSIPIPENIGNSDLLITDAIRKLQLNGGTLGDSWGVYSTDGTTSIFKVNGDTSIDIDSTLTGFMSGFRLVGTGEGIGIDSRVDGGIGVFGIAPSGSDSNGVYGESAEGFGVIGIGRIGGAFSCEDVSGAIALDVSASGDRKAIQVQRGDYYFTHEVNKQSFFSSGNTVDEGFIFKKLNGDPLMTLYASGSVQSNSPFSSSILADFYRTSSDGYCARFDAPISMRLYEEGSLPDYASTDIGVIVVVRGGGVGPVIAVKYDSNWVDIINNVIL